MNRITLKLLLLYTFGLVFKALDRKIGKSKPIFFFFPLISSISFIYEKKRRVWWQRMLKDQFCFQIKDIALKASGAYKNCKPCSGSSSENRNRNYADSDAGSVSARFHCAYRRTGSSNSTPRMWGKEMEARLKGLSSGEATPASVSGRTESIVFMEEDEPKEWVAQVEPGVLITFVSLPQEGNDLKRIRFRYFQQFGFDMIFKILIY